MKTSTVSNTGKKFPPCPAAALDVDRGLFDCIMSVHILFHKCVFASLQGTGLTAGQPKLLEFLADNGPVMQKDLARACGIEPSTIARLLPRMENLDLILRSSMEGDRRAVLISLTERGQCQADLVKRIFVRCETKAFAGMSLEKQEHLLTVFRKIQQNLQTQSKTQKEKRGGAPGDRVPDNDMKQESTFHYCLMACQGLLQKQLFSRLSGTGLTPGQPKILEFLNHGEGCRQKEIAAACNIEPATVTFLLLNMEASGLICRNMEHGNRRSLHVYLTKQGRVMMQKTLTGLEETIGQAFRGILQEQKGFRKALEAVRGNLERALKTENR